MTWDWIFAIWLVSQGAAVMLSRRLFDWDGLRADWEHECRLAWIATIIVCTPLIWPFMWFSWRTQRYYDEVQARLRRSG